MSHELLKKNSGLLFGGEAPGLRKPGKYSFAWQGQFLGEHSFKILLKGCEAKSVPELLQYYDSLDYRGFG